MSAQAQGETLLCTVDCKFNRTETKECELIECILCVGKFHHSCVGVDVKKSTRAVVPVIYTCMECKQMSSKRAKIEMDMQHVQMQLLKRVTKLENDLGAKQDSYEKLSVENSNCKTRHGLILENQKHY